MGGPVGLERIDDINLDRFLDAGRIQAHTGFVAVALDNQCQGIAQVLSTFLQRTPLTDRAGNFFDPPHEPAVRFRLDDGVIALFFIPIILPKLS